MSDEFLAVARKEILADLEILKNTASRSGSDKGILQNSEQLESRFHKIAGLAPMIDHEKVGEVAKACDEILKHVIKNGTLPGLHAFIVKTIDDMTRVFMGLEGYDISGFKRSVRDKFPQIPIP